MKLYDQGLLNFFVITIIISNFNKFLLGKCLAAVMVWQRASLLPRVLMTPGTIFFYSEQIHMCNILNAPVDRLRKPRISTILEKR